MKSTFGLYIPAFCFPSFLNNGIMFVVLQSFGISIQNLVRFGRLQLSLQSSPLSAVFPFITILD